jgi:fatty-acyl-CoA synthase
MTASPSPWAGDLNWASTLAYHADRSPGRIVIRFGRESLTYAGLYQRVRRLAAGLRAAGLDRGQVVGLLADNSPEFLEVMLAVNYVGAVIMPVNPRLADREIAYILGHSRAKMLVVGADSEALGARAVAKAETLVRGVRMQSPVGHDAAEGDWPRLDSLRAGAPDDGPAQMDPGDLHRLMYTSGTTSRPKGVMISHGNLFWKNAGQSIALGLTRDDVGLICGPLYHVGALDLTATTLLHVGGTLVIQPRFQAADVIDELARGAVTTVWLAPAMLNAVLAEPGAWDRDMSSLRILVGGGEKMPEHLIHRLQAVFPNAWFADAYGLTETVSGDTFLDADSVLSRRGSVGKAVPYLDVAVWDPQTGKPVAAGVPGEVVLRGPKVFGGYWENPEATSQAFAGGWFHTGDVGVADEDGYLYIVDRLKDVIISGGENVASSEVERVIYDYPGVHECAVVARQDARWGEVPVAFVVMAEASPATEASIIEHCHQALARFKTPKAVIFVDALPRTPSGKVLKRVLRETADGQ